MTDNEELFDESVSGNFGYCLSYEGATNAVRKYEKKTSTKYAVGHQEHPGFGQTDPTSRRHKVWFESRMDSKRKKEKIHFDGTPYISLNEKRLGCIYDKKSAGRGRVKRKAGCPAMIILREIAAFPNYSITANTTTLKEKASKKLRGSMKTCQVPFQRRIYVEFPKESDHCGHNTYSDLPTLSFVENVGMYSDGIEETVSEQQPDSLFDENRVSTSEMHPKTKKQSIIKDLIVSKQTRNEEPCNVWDDASNMLSREPCSTRDKSKKTLSSESLGGKWRHMDKHSAGGLFSTETLEAPEDDAWFELLVEEVSVDEGQGHSTSPMISALPSVRTKASSQNQTKRSAKKVSKVLNQNPSSSKLNGIYQCDSSDDDCDRKLECPSSWSQGTTLYSGNEFTEWDSNLLFEEAFNEDAHNLLSEFRVEIAQDDDNFKW